MAEPINKDDIRKFLTAGKKAPLVQYANLLAKVKAGEELSIPELKKLTFLQKELESDQAGDGKVKASGRSFSTALAVTDYLIEQGYKVKKSTVYSHHRQGLLRKRKNGTFSLEDVKKYAAANLDHLDGTSAVSPETEQIQMEKLDLERRRERAETELAELKLESRRRDLIAGPLEQQLAARLILLKSRVEIMKRTLPPRLAVAVKGDLSLIPEMTALLEIAFEDMLNFYYRGREATISGAGTVLFTDDDIEADEADESPEEGTTHAEAIP